METLAGDYYYIILQKLINFEWLHVFLKDIVLHNFAL